MWGKTPSELLGIEDPYGSYCVNEAIWAFGISVRNAVDEAGKSGKNERIRQSNAQNKFRQMMGMGMSFAAPPASK